MRLRPAMPSDASDIHRVHERAFPTAAEADLVDQLVRAGDAVISIVAIEDPSPLAGAERADLAARRAAGEPAGAEPGVECADADAQHREHGERAPAALHPDAGGLVSGAEALPKQGEPVR